MEYRIVSSSLLAKLEKEVNLLLGLGFLPVGGITIGLYSPNGIMFYQTMLKLKNGV